MSTSCELWPPVAASSGPERFQYPVVETTATPPLGPDPLDELRILREQALGSPDPAAVQAALEQGRREGETRAKAWMEPKLEQERAAMAETLAAFRQQRKDYFRRVEADVVRLALAIARRVLYREAQVDPLMLAGVVRVALDRMHAGTKVTLRCTTPQVELWRQRLGDKQEIAQAQNLTVVGDSSLDAQQCVLQADVGSTEISLEGRLQEIESGFFDLLADRPGAAVEDAADVAHPALRDDRDGS